MFNLQPKLGPPLFLRFSYHFSLKFNMYIGYHLDEFATQLAVEEDSFQLNPKCR